MTQWLRQSTAVVLKLGPFVDSTTGYDVEDGLTIGQADIQLSKNGAAFAQTSEASPTTTHDADGWYPIPLTTTDTGTLGRLDVQVAMDGALPVFASYMVVPANVWDSMFGADYLQTHAVEIANDLITAAAFDESTAFPLTSADTGTTAVARTGADGDTLETLSDEIAAVQSELDNPDQFKADVSGVSTLDAAGVRTAVGLASANLDAQLGALPTDSDVQDAASAALVTGNIVTTTDLSIYTAPLATQASVNDLPTNAELATALASADDAVLAAIAALNDLSSAGAQAAAAAALTAYAAAKTSDLSSLALQASVDDLEGRLTAARAGYLDNLSGGAVALESTVRALNDVSSSDVQAAAAAALTAYDPPTKAELDSAVAGMNDLSAAEVRSAVGLASANLDTQLAALPTAVENADALLTRDMSAPTGEAARSVLNAMRFLRNKWSLSGTTLTVYEEDDTTVAFTATVSTTADADSVTGADPT